MRRSKTVPALHNFLFMIPAGVTRAEEEIILNLARRLTSMGYVYVACSGVETMTDRDDMRFLPLHPRALPSFGSMTGVFVVHNPGLAMLARVNYPDAHVLVIDPARIQEDLVDFEPEKVIASWPAARMTLPRQAA